MGISVKTRKMLWGKAASRCSIPECRRELVMDATETDDPSIVGEECHIVARENDGPRGESELSKEGRDVYDNLVLMCNVHHKLIDDQPNHYTVEILKGIKAEHQDWVRTTLSIDELKIQNELIYSTYIDEWSNLVDLDNWTAWTSYLLSSGQPSMSKQKLDKLEELQNWIFTRIMPNQYIDLENAFENFRRVLCDFIIIFEEHAVENNGILSTEKFYKIERWDSDLYSKLHQQFMFHVDLVEDLIVELTRAANYLCDQVRKYILSDFRMDKGILYIVSGPDMGLTFRSYKVSYSAEMKTGIPYNNLEAFKRDRAQRDIHFGVGKDVEEAIQLGEEYY